MAQATHGSAPDIAGRGIANPYAMIVSAQMLLEWLGYKHGEARAVRAAGAIGRAVDEVIESRISLTPDLGGSATTSQMGDAIAQRVRGD
jgi:3-isopropylmalate dehydrogenase